MRGQVGLEYLLMFGVSLAIVGLVWVYASSEIETTKWELQVAYAKDAINRITEVADMM